MVEGLTRGDFQLVNRWREDADSGFFFDSGDPVYVIDESTGKKYLNSSESVIRACFVILVTVGTPIYHTGSVIAHMAYRIAKVGLMGHFWVSKEGSGEYSIKERGLEAFEDLAKIVASPFILCALEVSAVYGLFRPLDGRKLYATLERVALSERFYLAPCFQPHPQRHLFGGDLMERDSL